MKKHMLIYLAFEIEGCVLQTVVGTFKEKCSNKYKLRLLKSTFNK